MPHKLLPAPGYTYEGKHGESNGPHMLLASGITLGLAGLITALRLIVKVYLVRSAKCEDFLALAALLLAIVRTVMLSISKYCKYYFHYAMSPKF